MADKEAIQILSLLELDDDGIWGPGQTSEAIDYAIAAIRERAKWREAWHALNGYLFVSQLDFVNFHKWQEALNRMAELDPRKVKDETV